MKNFMKMEERFLTNLNGRSSIPELKIPHDLTGDIHIELFEEYNEDIYPVEKEFPLVEDISVDFKLFGKNYSTQLEDNKTKLLQQFFHFICVCAT